jgi:predicted metal-binding membrane protein
LSSTAERRPTIAGGSRRGVAPLLAGLIALCWAMLWLWRESPYARYLDHGGWIESTALCRALPAGQVLAPAILYVGAWLLMLAAMMLPTVLPLLDRFDRLVRERPDRGRLAALVVAGYFLVWAGFGAAAHILDAWLHAAARQSGWLALNGWLIGATVLAVAGFFQFSRLKYHCLARCRTPASFVVKHWRGPRPRRDALLLGLDHGLFCVGCCWAIMLLMFVVGAGSLGWMLALGAVMALEKNARWGARLSRLLGVVLLAGAVFIAGSNLAA